MLVYERVSLLIDERLTVELALREPLREAPTGVWLGLAVATLLRLLVAEVLEDSAGAQSEVDKPLTV